MAGSSRLVLPELYKPPSVQIHFESRELGDALLVANWRSQQARVVHRQHSYKRYLEY